MTAFLGSKSGNKPASRQYCNVHYHYCLDYPASLFSKTWFSPKEDSLVFTTLDTLGEISVISTVTNQKLDSHLAFEQRLRALAAPGGAPNILSLIDGDDYYEVSFLYGGHWYHQKAGFFRGYDVLFTIRVPVNRPELMMRMKEDVKIEF